MGYYKNEEVEQQVEEANRPKPVSFHVAYDQTGDETFYKTLRRARLLADIQLGVWTTVGLIGAGLVLGFAVVGVMSVL